MSTDYAPGTVAVATVDGRPDTRAIRYDTGYEQGWYAPEGLAHRWKDGPDVTDIRPLVVLDLNGHSPEALTDQLAREGFADIADQIEAQTKPPRIPEPGLWGVVEAHVGVRDRRKWVHAPTGWIDYADTGFARLWSDLIAPVLIREGVES